MNIFKQDLEAVLVYKIEDDRAYIFTNNHVVEGSDAIQVLLQDGTRVDAEVEGTDVWTDLAVLSVDASNIETSVEFGDSESCNRWRTGHSDWLSSRY